MNGTGTQVQKAVVPGLAEFRRDMTNMQAELGPLVEGWIETDHFIELAISSYLGNSDLWSATPLSIIRALRRSAQLRLRPDGEEGAVVVYKKTAEFQPMVKGIIRTLLRTKTVRKVEARVVRTGDKFEYWYGLNPDLRHFPGPSGQRGEVTHAYAIVWLTNGDRQFEVMDADELERVRRASRAPDSPAWRNWPEEMQRKAVVRRLSKYLEMDARQAAVVRYDEALEVGRDFEPADVLPDLDVRSPEQKAQDNAERQMREVEQGLEILQDRSLASKRVGFGQYHDATWGWVRDHYPGYITHYVLTDRCYMVSEQDKHELRQWIGEEPSPEPDTWGPEELDAALNDFRRAVAETKGLTDDERERMLAEAGMLHDEGNLFALHDATAELDKRIREQKGNVKPGDLFGGSG